MWITPAILLYCDIIPCEIISCDIITCDIIPCDIIPCDIMLVIFCWWYLFRESYGQLCPSADAACRMGARHATRPALRARDERMV